MKQEFKMWANSDDEAQSIMNYMYASGYDWQFRGHELWSYYGGVYANRDGSITYTERYDRKYYDAHPHKEFHFATPVHLHLPEEWVEVSELDGQLEVDMGDILPDMVNNPSHYTSHPSGIECIEITRFMSFNLGNALKYIWRCDLKKDAIEDLKKAIFYLNDEIALREKSK